MSTRKINITFEIEDNDQIQYNFENLLNSIIGDEKIIDFRVFPDVSKFENDTNYKRLVKAKRDAGLTLDRYINDNR